MTVAEGERRALNFWRRLPDDLTVADALTVPVRDGLGRFDLDAGGRRNLMLRKALGIKFPSHTECAVDRWDTIRVAVADQRRADYLAGVLRDALTGWTVNVSKRGDGRWLVTGYYDGADHSRNLGVA